MIKEYRDYCDEPSVQTVCNLFEAVSFSDVGQYSHEQLYDIWVHGCRKKHEAITLHTSGSTRGKPNPYLLGPYGTRWIKLWERATKFPKSQGMVLLRNRNLEGHRYSSDCVIVEHADYTSWQYNTFLTVPYFNEDIVREVCERLDELRSVQNVLTVVGDPHIWLYLTSSERFTRFMVRNRDSISIVSSNSEAFFKKKQLRCDGVYINDTMINWQNGVNFYTCGYGNKHSYPLFIVNGSHVVNLLNLTGDFGCFDDLVSIGEFCGCGRKIIGFVPHHEVQPVVDGFEFDVDIAEGLVGHYESFQFVQDDVGLVVYFVGDPVVSDFRGFSSYNGCVRVNNKIPAFYRNLCGYPVVDVGGRVSRNLL